MSKLSLWFRSLDRRARIVVVAGAASGLVIVGALAGSANPAARVELADAAHAPTNVARSDGKAQLTPEPVETTKEIVETSPLPFERVTVPDPGRLVGDNAVTTPGADGVMTTTYRVTFRDGVEVFRRIIGATVTTAPVNEVTSMGSAQPAPPPPPPPPPAPVPAPVAGGGCDSNYADGCVPIASDVDCAGGSGNGPAYVSGIVRVVGADIYDLDRDGDGYGCD